MNHTQFTPSKGHPVPSQIGLSLTIDSVDSVLWISGSLALNAALLRDCDTTGWIRSLAALAITLAHQAPRISQLDTARISMDDEWVHATGPNGPIQWIPFRCPIDRLFPGLAKAPQFLFLRCRQFTSPPVLLFDGGDR